MADLQYQGMVDEAEFLRLVSYETCDMNHIPDHLRGFDFCWSACCLEHLGSIRHGLDFIINSLDTLNPGGMAVHTTELNLSSNDATVETGPTVLFRRRDLEDLMSEVEALGHSITPLSISLMATPLDHHVDVPPYGDTLHLKLLLMEYVSTSVGVVIRKAS
ncbi:hypothetical protein [Aurantimonas sp. HBX-1]|uniref:hypothetical protein n=1 Tax=Aurantimonas sp. HBX-1 TaxID=2906072 RepID=UPI001F43DFD5|nr:hypothetical protein [Aurantimonas sp. HBX-1]UIJ71052.1 hypothetical protein LXB15_15165 [Aurantimonas sp. HBX-1]